MIGACLKPRCPACRAASGPDCADASRGKRGQKAHEERQWRREMEDEMAKDKDDAKIIPFRHPKPPPPPTDPQPCLCASHGANRCPQHAS